MQDTRTTILVGIIVVFLILLVQNTGVVTFRFLIWKVQVSQVALIAIVGLVAFAGGYISHAVKAAKKKRQGSQHVAKR